MKYMGYTYAKKIICCLSGIPMLLGILYFCCCCWMWHIYLHMSKGVPSVEGRERKCGWHSCTAVNTVNNYWHVFWGPFRSLSKAMRLVCSFLWKPCCSSWTCNPAWCWQPRQHYSFLSILFVHSHLPWGFSWTWALPLYPVEAKVKLDISLD